MLMEEQTLHYRHVLLYYFRKGKNARQACKKLCKVYGDNALQERQCQRWFTKFRAGDYNLNDAPRSGRPVEVDDEELKALIEANPQYSAREIAEILNIHHSTVHDHLKKLRSSEGTKNDKKREISRRSSSSTSSSSSSPCSEEVKAKKIKEEVKEKKKTSKRKYSAASNERLYKNAE